MEEEEEEEEADSMHFRRFGPDIKSSYSGSILGLFGGGNYKFFAFTLVHAGLQMAKMVLIIFLLVPL